MRESISYYCKSVVHLFLHLALFKRLSAAADVDARLTVSNGRLMLNGEKVFLSGMNIESIILGNDFGNRQYECCTGTGLQSYLKNISAAGGNSVRVLMHSSARYSPMFNQTGFVIGTDRTGTMISDLGRFLDAACDNSVFVIVVIWYFNSNEPLLFDLLSDTNKLQSYIDNVLVPMVGTLKDKPALAAWEIIHSPESMVLPGSSTAPCYNTPHFPRGKGSRTVPMQSVYAFINLQAAAIRSANPRALVTAGASSALARSDVLGYRTYFSDACLTSVTNSAPNGTLSFYSISAIPNWPLTAMGAQQPDKPTIISSFNGDKQPMDQQMVNAYYGGFSGAFTWKTSNIPHDPRDLAMQEMALTMIRNHNSQRAGGHVNVRDIHKACGHPHDLSLDKHVFTIVSLSVFALAGLVVLVALMSALASRRKMHRATSMFAVTPWSFRRSTRSGDEGEYESVSEFTPYIEPETPLLSANQSINRTASAAATGRPSVRSGQPPRIASLTHEHLRVHAASTPREYMTLCNGSECSSAPGAVNRPPPRLPPPRV